MNKLQWNLNRNHTFPFKKINLKMSSGKWRPSCLGLNVLNADQSAYKIHNRVTQSCWYAISDSCDPVLCDIIFHRIPHKLYIPWFGDPQLHENVWNIQGSPWILATIHETPWNSKWSPMEPTGIWNSDLTSLCSILWTYMNPSRYWRRHFSLHGNEWVEIDILAYE